LSLGIYVRNHKFKNIQLYNDVPDKDNTQLKMRYLDLYKTRIIIVKQFYNHNTNCNFPKLIHFQENNYRFSLYVFLHEYFYVKDIKNKNYSSESYKNKIKIQRHYFVLVITFITMSW
jgi:hypothetical protein